MIKRRFGDDRRGLAVIISTVLILAITVPTIVVLWTAVVPYVNNVLLVDMSSIELQIISSDGYTLYDDEDDLLAVQIKRGNDDIKLKHIYVVISIDGNSNSYFVNALRAGSSRVYYFGDIYKKPSKVLVYASIPLSENGETTSANSEWSDIALGDLDPDNIVATGNWIYLSDGRIKTFDCQMSGGDNNIDLIGGYCVVAGSVPSIGVCDVNGTCQDWECVADFNCDSGNSCKEDYCDSDNKCKFNEVANCSVVEGACWDGVINEGETCDRYLFDGKTCASEGLSGGVLNCNDDCTIDYSNCAVGSDEVESAGYFFSGNGVDDPYMIFNCYQLQNMSYALDANYKLAGNVDCSMAKNGDNGWWADGKGFMPIGDSSNPFTGNLDGNNFEISGLYINRPNEANVSLFGYSDGGVVIDLGIAGVDILGRDSVGGLIGVNKDGIVDNCYSSGKVTVVHPNDNANVIFYAGGLVAYNSESSKIDNSYSICNVSGIGGSLDIGGLVGGNKYSSFVENCWAGGKVDGSNIDNWRIRAGGLIGYNHFNSTIKKSYASGDVVAFGEVSGVGGLVGYNNGGCKIVDSYANGTVNGDGDGGIVRVGGLVGLNTIHDTDITIIRRSYSIGNVSASSNNAKVGGLVGENLNDALIVKSYYIENSCTYSVCNSDGEDFTDAQMKDSTKYGWNFDDTWSIGEGKNNGYPWLRVFG